MDDTAGHVVHSCVEAFQSLVVSLLEGNVTFEHLQTCLKFREQFKRLYHQCMDFKSFLGFLVSH